MCIQKAQQLDVLQINSSEQLSSEKQKCRPGPPTLLLKLHRPSCAHVCVCACGKVLPSSGSGPVRMCVWESTYRPSMCTHSRRTYFTTDNKATTKLVFYSGVLPSSQSLKGIKHKRPFRAEWESSSLVISRCRLARAPLFF